MVTLPSYLEESRRQPLTLAAGIRRVVSFPVLLGSILILGGFTIAKDFILDPDTWWHIAVGQRILATHAWPWSDTYSSTVTGTPWIAYEWLGEVLIGAAASFAGLWSATIFLVAVSGILVALIYYYASMKCGNSKAAFVACATLVPTLGAFFTLRPQLLGAVFLVITLIILELFRQGHERALWILPPLFLCWVNTHGSFVFGFFVLGVAWLSGQVEFSSGGLFSEKWTKRQSVQLLFSTLLSVLVLPITPYGTRTAAYPLMMALTQPVNVKNIKEWFPLGTDLFLGKMFLGVMLLFFLACLVERPRFRLADITLAIFGVFAASVHLRFLLLYVIFFSPLWAMLFARWVPKYEPGADHPIVNAGLIACIAVGLVFMFPSHSDLNQRVDSEYPRAAVQYLKTHPVTGKVFNDYGWGGYLIWSGEPKNMIFIDGRADIYEYEGVLSDYLGIARLEPNALHLMKKYDIDAFLIRRDAPLAIALSAMPGWERAYDDPLAALYVRKPMADAMMATLQNPSARKAAP